MIHCIRFYVRCWMGIWIRHLISQSQEYGLPCIIQRYRILTFVYLVSVILKCVFSCSMVINFLLLCKRFTVLIFMMQADVRRATLLDINSSGILKSKEVVSEVPMLSYPVLLKLQSFSFLTLKNILDVYPLGSKILNLFLSLMTFSISFIVVAYH